jgi:hypothetical protein
LTLGVFELVLSLLDFLFQDFNLVDLALFAFPLRGELFILLLQLG